MIENFVWSEKYRPKTIDEVIVPDRIKSLFKGFVEQGSLGRLLLKGPPGLGKTTIAVAACEELKSDWIIRNGSLDGNIALLRTDLVNFASTVSLRYPGRRKNIIIDESDRMSLATYDAMRGFTQEYSENCSFIFTANYPQKIPKELKSRLTEIDFRIREDEKRDILRAMYVRIAFILSSEGVTFDKNAVAQLMKRYAPDWRKCIDECQRFSVQNNNVIDAGILSTGMDDSNIGKLFQIIQDKNFDELRKWVANNMDMEPNIIFRSLFDHMHKYLTPASVAYLITTLADYQYKAALVADQEINVMACLVTFTAEAEFK